MDISIKSTIPNIPIPPIVPNQTTNIEEDSDLLLSPQSTSPVKKYRKVKTNRT
jgi:hypothetical protein